MRAFVLTGPGQFTVAGVDPPVAEPAEEFSLKFSSPNELTLIVACSALLLPLKLTMPEV